MDYVILFSTFSALGSPHLISVFFISIITSLFLITGFIFFFYSLLSTSFPFRTVSFPPILSQASILDCLLHCCPVPTLSPWPFVSPARLDLHKRHRYEPGVEGLPWLPSSWHLSASQQTAFPILSSLWRCQSRMFTVGV